MLSSTKFAGVVELLTMMGIASAELSPINNADFGSIFDPRAMWKTYLISRDIDFTKELDESSSADPTVEGVSENFAKFARKEEQANQGENKQFVEKNKEQERLAQQRRKAASDKRNAVAKERQAEREANRNSVEMAETGV